MSNLFPGSTLGDLKYQQQQNHKKEKASQYLFYLPPSGLPLLGLMHIPPSLLMPHPRPPSHCSPTDLPFFESHRRYGLCLTA